MKNHFLKSLLTAALLVFHLSSSAEDIDLFVGAGAATTADVPNVLIILDNTANWNTAFTNEMAALVSTVNALPASKFRLGLMLFTETGGGNSGNDGAYVRAAVRLLDSANKTKYQALVSGLDQTADKSNGGKIGKSMEEAYLYFSGGVPHAGNNKNKTDYAGNTSGTASSNAIYALAANALTSKAGTPYTSPVAPGCAKNYIIYISNGAAQDNTSDTVQATATLTAAGGSTTAIPISPSGSQDNVADEWARFMKQSSLGVITYTVDVNKVSTGQGPGWTALLKSMAGVSSGKYFDVSSSGTQIVDALKSIFSEIQSVNSVYAAVSLPVSVNTQGTYLNQVFIGMFRPDASSLPRWAGNLKQYKLGFIDNVLQLLDAEDQSAINNNTGFITECARSFWTPTTADSYWANMGWPSGMTTCIPPAGSASDFYLNSNFPDGNIVEKGAQAYKLRSLSTCDAASPATCTIASPRTVKTCSSSTFASCTALTNFDTSNTGSGAITTSLLGAADATERDALINWERGLDIADENINGATTTEMRRSAHGDVVHSRPVAINFGTDVSPQVVVFYGGNDGVLRAINGNRDGGLSVGSAAPGSELWAFVAPEFYPKIKRLRDNSPAVSYPGSVVTGALPKSYGFDGPITAYKDSSHTWIYATMRRGGRVLYAFDVTTPASPTLKWKKGCPNADNDTDCTTGFSGIGQTWSAPKTLKSSGYGSGASPMLIVGAGYDACEDTDNGTVNHNCTSSTKGNHVYVLDADSGVLLTTLDTERGVVGDISIVPDSSGLAQYAYAADLGGNVYRITIGTAAPASWTITKIAALGCATPAACSANRKFMFGPSVVADNGVYRLLLGSGDREKPLQGSGAAYGVANYFFMLKDSPTDSAWLSSENSTCSANVICKDSLFGITTSANPTQAQLDGKPKGWYLGLVAHEQVVTSAITLYGVVSFSTHQPAVPVTGSCSSNLGTANSYDIAYVNAASANGTAQRYEHITGDGLSPSPVGGMVMLDNGQTVPFLIKGIRPKEPVVPPGSTPIQPKSRAYWYIQQ